MGTGGHINMGRGGDFNIRATATSRKAARVILRINICKTCITSVLRDSSGRLRS
jgi:hypothetical protein